MRIAFYAPMKSPYAPVPSGERLIARLFMALLTRAGHDVDLACRLRSFDKRGDANRQQRLQRLGGKLAERLIRRYQALSPSKRPQLWFTYHLYHKAPDWIGPRVARALHIPYVVAEASFAPKQAAGAWATGHRAVEKILRGADLVLSLNNEDTPCIAPLLAAPDRLLPLSPFLDASRFNQAAQQRQKNRRLLMAEHDLSSDRPWLLAAAMMREGDKLASYQMLAEALGRLTGDDWLLLIAGDGPAEAQVRAAFAAFGERVLWLGRCNGDQMAALYAASDLLVWPGIHEAIGMALLEAQASGLPVVSGRSGAAPQIIEDGRTGLIADYADAVDFAAKLAMLLGDPQRRKQMGQAALEKVKHSHDLDAAGERLNRAFEGLIA